MAYVKTDWNTGDVVTAAKLNNIENGVAAADNIFFLRYGLPTIGGQEIEQVRIKIDGEIGSREMNYDEDAKPYLERMAAGEPLIPIIDTEDNTGERYGIAYAYTPIFADTTSASEVDMPNYFVKSGRPVLYINGNMWLIDVADLDVGTKPAH